MTKHIIPKECAGKPCGFCYEAATHLVIATEVIPPASAGKTEAERVDEAKGLAAESGMSFSEALVRLGHDPRTVASMTYGYLCCKHYTVLFGDFASCDLPTAGEVLIEGGLRVFQGMIRAIAANPEAAQEVMQKAWSRASESVVKTDEQVSPDEHPTAYEKAGGAPIPQEE